MIETAEFNASRCYSKIGDGTNFSSRLETNHQPTNDGSKFNDLGSLKWIGFLISTRWAVWLIVDSNSHVWMAEPSGGTTPQPSRRSGTATLSMMLQSKTGSQEWCNGHGVINKWCKWYNYTINDCNDDDYTTSSKPLVSIYAVPDQFNTFGTVQNFDVLYQNCTNRCGIAKLSCCD
jgi:hypothetical protein